MIEFLNVSKNYGKKNALSRISLKIESGIYGLVGENGAGKSTLIKLITGELTPSSGEIIREDCKIGYLPQNFRFFKELTLDESMRYLAELKGVPCSMIEENTDFWLYRLNLQNERKKKIKELSGGMMQRFGIAQAFLGDPDIIVLDEPTIGLDPRERISFRNMINEYAENKTVILSTHIISDVSSTCEYIVVVSDGRLLFEGNVHRFISSVERDVYSLNISRADLPVYQRRYEILSVKRTSSSDFEIRFMEKDQKCQEESMIKTPITLEDAYYYYVYLQEREL